MTLAKIILDRVQNLQTEIEEKREEVNEKQKEIDAFDKSEYISESQYDESLDETCERVSVGGQSWAPSQVLKGMDYTAYRQGFNDYIDSIDEDSISEYCDLDNELVELQDELSDLEDDLEEAEEELWHAEND